MKHKLINIETKETHLCNKLTIEGFDYYVSDETPPKSYDGFYFVHNKLFHTSKTLLQTGCKNVIATNNKNIDCPKVVDEVEYLALSYEMSFIDDDGTTIVDYKEGYNKAKETYSNSDEDMIEFADWLDNNKQQREYHPMSCMSHKELLQLFKQQQPKTIYFN